MNSEVEIKLETQVLFFKIRESEVVVVEASYTGSGENRREKRVIKIKKIDRLGLAK